MNYQKERVFNITAGPSKDTIFDACKYAYSRNAINLHFAAVKGLTSLSVSEIVINSIEHEPMSANKLILGGFCYARPFGNTEFKASYDTKIRKGKIEFIE